MFSFWLMPWQLQALAFYLGIIIPAHFPTSSKVWTALNVCPLYLFPPRHVIFFFFFAISRCCIKQKCLLFDLHSKHKICFKKGLTILNEWHFPGRTYCTESTTIRHKPARTFWASTENSAVGAGAMVFPSRQSQIRFNPSSMQLACWHPELVPMACLGFSIWKWDFHLAPLKYHFTFHKFSIIPECYMANTAYKLSGGTPHHQLAPWELQHSIHQPQLCHLMI